MRLVNEVFRCCARKETPVSPQILVRTGVAQQIGNVSSSSLENTWSREMAFRNAVMSMSVDDFLREVINAEMLFEVSMTTPGVMLTPMPRGPSASVASGRGQVCELGPDMIVHKPIVRMPPSHVAVKKAATSSSSVHSRNGIGGARSDGVITAVHKNSSRLRRSEADAAIKIQRAWRAWQARVQTLIARAPEGERFVFTRSSGGDPSGAGEAVPGVHELMTVHAIPVHGKGPVLSFYAPASRRLGQGACAQVGMGPRGYICRVPVPGKVLPPMLVDASRFADLKSFVACTRVVDTLDIGRYAGQDLYEYLSTLSRALPIGLFKKASADLKSLHERGLFHMDIKLDNMTYLRKKSGEEIISFIDCDRITNVPEYMPTLCRWMIRSDAHDVKDGGTRADDEFSFLFSLMVLDDITFVPIYIASKKCLMEEQMDVLQRNAQHFVRKYILPEYRNDVLRFITLPIKENFLGVPLHDMFDWNAPPDLVAAMQQGDVALVRKLGAAIFSSAATLAQKKEFLLAQDAESIPGLYWAELGVDDSMRQAWLELFWQLPLAEQIDLRQRLFTLTDEFGSTGWFSPSMLPCRVSKS